ncbi:MAG: glycosyltransferase family 2 protein [Pseudomonadota bacterium]|nr:glycosyltransferase family 2 protein [Pseudomonadota bacterium]MDE3037281.1 glycosyltransferase family 2 protein [Pseudomonadota bacterium]
MTTLPVSVFIIALNEGDRIGRSIESVRGFADEVIVIDSGSTDDTVKISEAAGARVIHHGWPGYGAQKRFGEEQCRHDWLLNIDADEVVSAGLAEEIRAVFAGGTPEHSGYAMNIVALLPGEKKPGRFAHHVNAVRLYDRRCGRFRDSSVHDTVVMDKGTTGAFSAIVEHRSARGIAHSIEKINRYSTMQAEDMLRRGRRPPFLMARLFFEFPAGFFKTYVFRGHCFKGTYGFIDAVLYGFSRFARLAKYWEMTTKRSGS